MIYRTSQQLIDILLKFGFIEVTKIYFPIYWQIIEENKTYDSSTIRIFEINKLTVLFDASHIRVSVAKGNIYKADFLTTEELQSIMYSILYPLDYEKYKTLVSNPVYLMSYLKKQIEDIDNISQTDKVDYSETINTIFKISLE